MQLVEIKNNLQKIIDQKNLSLSPKQTNKFQYQSTSRPLHNTKQYRKFAIMTEFSCDCWLISCQVSRLVSRYGQTRRIHINNHEIQEAGIGKYLVILAPFAAGAGVVAYAK